jgi:ribosomal protein S18 acetylase RimI-like enzyme
MIIRKFRIKDYDALIKLWKAAELPNRPYGRDRRDKIKEQIKKKCSIYLVAELDGKIVGSILGSHDGRKGWINRLAVLPKYRKRGIGAKLLGEVEKRLCKQGIGIIACLIEDWNITSMMVFERLGYEKHPEIIYFTKKKNPRV